MAEITRLPGLDERLWGQVVPAMRASLAKLGFGDPSIDAILADLKPRVLWAAPVSREGPMPKEIVRVVSEAYMLLVGEMLVLAAENYLLRNYPNAAPAHGA